MEKQMGKEIKRMRYFDGLFLDAEDYSLEQEYHRRSQQLHNRYLHSWGIFTGLEVIPKEDAHLQVVVTQGVALNQVDVEDPQTKQIESIGQEIYICEGHPDNPLDLSEYDGNESVYITVSYEEALAEKSIEKGQGKEIHIWERGRLSHSNKLPEDPKKEILLARVVIPNKESEDIKNSDKIIFTKDNIKYTKVNGDKLRKYAGPAGKEFCVEKLMFQLNPDEIIDIPRINAVQENILKDNEPFDRLLEIDSPLTRLTGDVHVMGDFLLDGELTMKSKNMQDEMLIANKTVQVNSDSGNGTWKLAESGGLDVYRGKTDGSIDAHIVWNEAEGRWKAGVGSDMGNMAYGPSFDRLTDKTQIVDDLHGHSQLASQKGTALSIDSSGDISVQCNMALNDKTLSFRDLDNESDGLGWFGEGKTFAGIKVDGPALFGSKSGVLGTACGGQKAVLSWCSNGNVGVGSINPKDDKLDVAGSTRVLSSTNPIRFTSTWTRFPDFTTNQAEICNDTTYHKTLMIVGNQSAGQGRKVSIWDRLDVNGFLYVNGSMQISQALTPSAGSGKNGIVFPSDPGGGSSDSAWIKYYPRAGEACTLEIGTSNDRNDNISLMPSGSVGIGTANPGDKLEVCGGLRILTSKGQNPIRFTSAWKSFGNGSNQAEISNDTGNYKALMIVGNGSSGQRRVGIWDRLDVNGSLQVNGSAVVAGNLKIKGKISAGSLDFGGQSGKLRVGTLYSSGAIVPSAGRGNNGIIFPSDPGGGSGDRAWIKYYPRSGEACTLEIGISNDRGDKILLNASGGVYGGHWFSWSSREFKENIKCINTNNAKKLLEGLTPVSFKYKNSNRQNSMGFISEEVPKEFSNDEQNAVSGMDIIAVLTSVVKDQQKSIAKLQKQIKALGAA